MKATSWSFIVISAHSPVLEKIGLSFRAAMILVAAFVIAFFTTMLLFFMFPSIKFNELDRVRLAAENQTLRVENKNISLQIGKLNTQMSHVEEHSQRVVALMEAD